MSGGESAQGLVPQAIAITGCIGSGKSKVARWLGQEWTLPVFDADEEVRALLTPGQSGWLRLRSILDASYFDVDSRLLKSKLRQAIFNDALLRRDIEEVIHPLVLAKIKEKTAQFSMQCLVEVPLLYEANWQIYFHKVLVVYADPMTCLRRVMARDRVSESEALAALNVQRPVLEKLSLADFTVDNSGTWLDTLTQLKTIKK